MGGRSAADGMAPFLKNGKCRRLSSRWLDGRLHFCLIIISHWANVSIVIQVFITDLILRAEAHRFPTKRRIYTDRLCAKTQRVRTEKSRMRRFPEPCQVRRRGWRPDGKMQGMVSSCHAVLGDSMCVPAGAVDGSAKTSSLPPEEARRRSMTAAFPPVKWKYL